MKELDYIPNNSQLTLTDRVAIEVRLAKKESFAKIAKQLRKHPRTIAREVKENRTHLPAKYAFGNDCKNYASCRRIGLCGADPEACDSPCKKCRGESCHVLCDNYESSECQLPNNPPYVYNTCKRKGNVDVVTTACREGRTYADFEKSLEIQFCDWDMSDLGDCSQLF